MLSSAQPLNHIYVTMRKQAHTCMLWVQGSSILIKDDGTGTDTENKRYCLQSSEGQCTHSSQDAIHFSQDDGCVHLGLPLWVLW